MIYSIVVTNYLGDRIKLELGKPDVSGFLIKSITGLGPAKANVNTTEVSTNDGSLFNSARLSQRNIVLDMVFINTVYGESIEDLRQKSYKYFPLKKSVELTIETDNRYVKTTGYVESNEPNIFSSQEGTQISIICPDPYFYSAGEDGKVILWNIQDLSVIMTYEKNEICEVVEISDNQVFCGYRSGAISIWPICSR